MPELELPTGRPAATWRAPQLPTEPSCWRLRPGVLNHGGNDFVTFLEARLRDEDTTVQTPSDLQQPIAAQIA